MDEVDSEEAAVVSEIEEGVVGSAIEEAVVDLAETAADEAELRVVEDVVLRAVEEHRAVEAAAEWKAEEWLRLNHIVLKVKL